MSSSGWTSSNMAPYKGRSHTHHHHHSHSTKMTSHVKNRKVWPELGEKSVRKDTQKLANGGNTEMRDTH
jgi:hypothetical protein